MNQFELKKWIDDLIAENKLWQFYKSKEWLALKAKVLKVNHYECAECRKQGTITRYDIGADGRKRKLSTVHHIVHVRDNPALALTESNLEPVCKACHNKLHPEKNKNRNKYQGFTNVERW